MLKRSLIGALAILCASCGADKSADSGHELSQSGSTLSDMGGSIPSNQHTRDWIGIADQLTPKSQNDSEDRSQERSGQSSQKQQAEPSPTDQQQALRGYVYGAQNDEVAFRKAAKAITR